MNDVPATKRRRGKYTLWISILTLLIAACTVSKQPVPEQEVVQEAAHTVLPMRAAGLTTPTGTPTPRPTATAAPTEVPSPTPTTTETSTPSPSPSPSSTSTPGAVLTATTTATSTPTAPPETPTVATTATPADPPRRAEQGVQSAGASPVPPLILANYFTWFDNDGWSDCNISAGDRPAQPYSSDDPAAIKRHVEQALGAGIDGFTANWFAPGNRTDHNFATLLAQSQGTDFHSTVVFSRHIWPAPPATPEAIIAAIRYILDTYAQHPNFLHAAGKPVLFFTDVYRVPRAGSQTAQEAWAAIRAVVEPQHETWWIAEGLDPSFLSVFDGLYAHKITHASLSNDYAKASQWADDVRAWAAQTGARKLWVATVMPGWDDRDAGCRTDVRVPTNPHRRSRNEGAFYRATFEAALTSAPHWLWINSFNEWVEGTYIEPSIQYGDTYLRLTREFADRFKGR